MVEYGSEKLLDKLASRLAAGPRRRLFTQAGSVWLGQWASAVDQRTGIDSLNLEPAMTYADSFWMRIEGKFCGIGNSVGVIIPTEALALLDVKEGDRPPREAAEGSARLSARHPGFAEKAGLADDLIQRYRNALSELAK